MSSQVSPHWGIIWAPRLCSIGLRNGKHLLKGKRRALIIFHCFIGKVLPEGEACLKDTLISQSDTCPIEASKKEAEGQNSKLWKDRAEYPSFLFWDEEMETHQV